MNSNSKPGPIPPNDFLDLLSKALNIPYAQRIVLDVQFGHFPKIYIQAVADERLLSVDWAGELKDTKIIGTDDTNKILLKILPGWEKAVTEMRTQYLPDSAEPLDDGLKEGDIVEYIRTIDNTFAEVRALIYPFGLAHVPLTLLEKVQG